ncbi:GNAT family N-acetyltransferase (plasmid) [Pantoea allii]|uniref:GNAT family N-acetyltransferase n=1 Tax=Pantoea TaxID=53335 RepID=UPI00105A9D92|nr:GNAT family N-acetyltransferase [Pantoea ananatis]TDL50792.1 N-acetyltransferase family protein [Pantoea ananatis]
MLIRPAKSDDLNAICEIYNHAVLHTDATFDTEIKTPEYFREFLGSTEYFFYLAVAEEESRIIGFSGLYPFSRRKAYAGLSELTCYVHQSAQRKSVGTALCQHVSEYAGTAGLHTILALFNTKNAAMRNICVNLGYVPKGEMSEVAFKLGQYQSLSIYQKFMRSN